MTKIIIEINGEKIEAQQGEMIIDVADNLKTPVHIPRFCYHKKLSVAANCRMCLVEIDKAPKPVPACATPVTAGMKICTNSPKVKEAQSAIMEFLLINHPLDCPICDQGGECELQDTALSYGNDYSTFAEGKRTIADNNFGALIASDMTRCIHCTRCVRFGEEIAGVRELGAIGRGENTKITSYLANSINSEISANVIDLCPVGALTSKPYRFKARAWELEQKSGISVFDGLGSNLYYYVRGEEVLRVSPRENNELNETWLADRDRFAYLGNNRSRARMPMIKLEGEWSTITWDEAISRLQNTMEHSLQKFGQGEFAGLIADNSYMEDGFLMQKWLTSFASGHIDFRLHQLDYRNEELGVLGLSCQWSAIVNQSAVLLIGSDIHKEIPLAGLKLRQCSIAGGEIFIINPVDWQVNFACQQRIIAPLADVYTALAKVTKAVAQLLDQEINQLANVNVDREHQQLAKALIAKDKPMVLLGQIALMAENSSDILWLADRLATMLKGSCEMLPVGANALGLAQVGCLPNKKLRGKNFAEMLQSPPKIWFLFAVDPCMDSQYTTLAMRALEQADFVVAFSSYQTASLDKYVNLLLPIPTQLESCGTLCNHEGRQQFAEQIIKEFADSKPLWKILRVIAEHMKVQGFAYNSFAEVRQDMLNNLQKKPQIISFKDSYKLSSLPRKASKEFFYRVAPIGLYCGKEVLRQAMALQQTQDAELTKKILLSPEDAQRLHVGYGDAVQVYTEHEPTNKIILLAVVEKYMPTGVVVIYQGHKDTVLLNAAENKVYCQAVKVKDV